MVSEDADMTARAQVVITKEIRDPILNYTYLKVSNVEEDICMYTVE